MSKNKAKKSGFIRVGAVSPLIRLADVKTNTDLAVAAAKRAAESGVRVLVFPELTLTGATCRDLYRQPVLLHASELGLARFIKETADLDMISFIGLPAELGDGCYNAIAAVYRGELLGISVKSSLSEEDSRYFDVPMYDIGRVSFAGCSTKVMESPVFKAPFNKNVEISVGLGYAHGERPDVIVCPSSLEATVGERERTLAAAQEISDRYNAAYVYANAGFGESTTDAVYSAHNVIANRGEIVAEALPFADDNLIVAEVAIGGEIQGSMHRTARGGIPYDDEFEDSIPKNPFLPADSDGQRVACFEAFEIQARGLAARMERSYSRAMIIGVSGGLDSTLALLVCTRAAEILGMDKKNIVGVTMPCFGTTKRTRSNAEKLCDALGVSFRTVDIKNSVIQHLADIGHDGTTPDVTYENAQARERTQVLMDIANMTGGLVVGTGDLSELVLGWATYNGDHMSMYAVNGSVPKTMVRRIVEVYSEREREDNETVADILDDILATPVSPELLPPKDGEIAQCTEALVGPYELHDFFIYCTLECGFSPREIYTHAKAVLGDVYDNKTILGWLRVFVRRFFNQQFKRSCLPDGPKVGFISVSPRTGLFMPSDASAAVWLEEVDLIETEEK